MFRKRTSIFSIIILQMLLSNALAEIEPHFCAGNGLDVEAFVCSSDETKLFVATRGQLHRSVDHGESWEELTSAILEAGNRDAGRVDEIIAFDSACDSLAIRVTLLEHPTCKVMVSNDGGDTWLYTDSGIENTYFYHQIVQDSRNHDRLIQVAHGTISNSYDFGQSWTEQVEYDDEGRQKEDILQDKWDPERFYIAGITNQSEKCGGVFVSEDGGNSFEPKIDLNEDAPNYNFIKANAIVQVDSLTLIASIGSKRDENGIMGHADCLFKSEDRGENWVLYEGLLPERYTPNELEVEYCEDREYIYVVSSIPGIGIGIYVGDKELSAPFEKIDAIREDRLSAVHLYKNEWNGHIYCSIYGYGVYRFENGGETVTPIPMPQNINRFGFISYYLNENDDNLYFRGMSDQVQRKYSLSTRTWSEISPICNVNSLLSTPYHDQTNNAMYCLGGKYATMDDNTYGTLLLKHVDDMGWCAVSDMVPGYDNTMNGIPYYANTSEYNGIFISIRQGFFNEESEIWSLENGSHEWRQIATEIPVRAMGPSMLLVSDTLYAACSEGVFRTKLDSDHWENLEHPDCSRIPSNKVMFTKDNKIYLMNILHLDVYDGESWERNYLGFASDAVAISKDRPYRIASWNSHDQLVISDDNGDTWETYDINMGENTEIIEFNEVKLGFKTRDDLFISTIKGLFYVDLREVLACGDVKVIPTEYDMNLYPNPSNACCVIDYTLPKKEYVEIKVYNVTGSEVAVLEQSEKAAGSYSCSFDGTGLASGTYYVRLKTDENVMTKSVKLVK